MTTQLNEPSPPVVKNRTATAKDVATARRFTIGLILVALVTVALVGYVFVVPSSKLVVGFIVIVLMMALILLKIPVGIAMSAAAMLGLYILVGPNAVAGSLKEVVFGSFASWSLSVIPMFVLMGVAMGKSGLMAGAYGSARKWLSRLPGGLAVATNFAGAGMAAASGSTIGITYAIGRVSIPEMIRAGYKPSLAMGATGMAGTLGQVIPPSILLVIYAGIAGTPVGPQLLAGLVPGLALAVLFAIVIVLWATISPSSGPRGGRFTWKARFASLIHLVPMLVIIAVVLGGIYSGVFTATEAGAWGALVALLLGLGLVIARSQQEVRSGESTVATRRVVGTFLSSTLLETVSAVATVMLLLVGVNLLTRVMALSGLAQWVADIVVALGLNKFTFLLLLIPIYLILGFFLDTLAMMLLTIPVFMAPLIALDVDLIWFGVFLIVLAEIDLVAPPLGILNFVVLAISKGSTKGMGLNLKITDVFKGVLPFIAACIVMLVVLILWPDLALWLPGISVAE
ncbi:TRAP transporter large permease [Microbacterium trichothecenolyticum]|uniref:Sialic acid TRAP transporter permease protein SiaT n=1 Tax=Microbacterium trichothecenolyticum TaxID=69370 RepID=A0A0M2H728_MICTR|nr:TRAP transporter large permease subunit [Microbacterium trichothecenolyticum]KJL42329.1 Sialic acid TRAP transporter permease protein SiaT [Microbacterium trichothecenolyticum]